MGNDEQQGMQTPFTGGSLLNQLDFLIEEKIRSFVNTSAIVKVGGCTSTGSSGPAGTVSATPMVAQTDAQGNALPMAEIASMPHVRVQGGIAALIIDPVGGDLGIASFCKADSSTVKTGTTEAQRPGSNRAFSQADGVLVGTISNKAPEVWIELKQDKTIVIHAPEGCTIESDKEIKLDAPQVVLTGNLTATGERSPQTKAGGAKAGGASINITGTLSSTGDQIAGGISQINHVHVDVQAGGDTTGKPK